ncbi:MAG TPA: CHAT domain-containing protein [Gemmataceae bacterium]|nr:CHAT domain-containing protein [Gemmataceae bacterium]
MDPSDASLLERDIVTALERHDVVRAAELAGRYRRDTPVQNSDGDLEEALWFRARYLSARADLASGQPSSAPEGLRPLLGVTRRLPASLACHIHLLAEHEALCASIIEDPRRPATAALPGVPTLEELQRALPRGAVYVAPALIGKDLFVLAVRNRASRVFQYPDATAVIDRQLQGWRQRLLAQFRLYKKPSRLGPEHRCELDSCLQALGEGPLGTALQVVWTDGAPGERLVWSPGAGLAGLPVHALRRGGRYLIEDHEVVQAFCGGLFVQHARLCRPPRWRRRCALVVTGGAEKKLKLVEKEGEGVLAAFPGKSKHLRDGEATREAIRPLLQRVGVAHFACHAEFNQDEPLEARLKLPSGQEWRALGWRAEPFAGLSLVTLSACRSGEVATAAGGEVFGLVYGLLGAGVRAVIGGLWEIPDLETPPLMWRFYREPMTADLATALARAQRETLADEGSSPFFWAVFALFGDAAALPAPGWLGRWWARRRQRRHASLYPAKS